MVNDTTWLEERSAESLRRLLPRIEARFRDSTDPVEWETYTDRLRRHFPRLFARLHALYGTEYDFFFHLESVAGVRHRDVARAAGGAQGVGRPARGGPVLVHLEPPRRRHLLRRPVRRETSRGCANGIPYLAELGVTYLHLMPLFKSPRGDDDGGYAVSSYREIDPDLGTMEQLAELATELRHHGISLALDFVFNHTSDEHEWARARHGR